MEKEIRQDKGKMFEQLNVDTGVGPKSKVEGKKDGNWLDVDFVIVCF